MAVSSVAVRSYVTKSLVTDSAVGLMVALAFMFLLYCFEKVMTPEQFMEHLIDGIADSTLPIILYLLTINFSTLLDSLGLHTYLEEMIDVFDKTAFLLPAVVFVLAMAVTVALGSSWSMYAVIFPIVLNFTRHLGISPALMVGAIAGAGIAGEKNCAFTAEAFNIANAVGINPEDAKKIRISYSAIFTALAAILYLIAGAYSGKSPWEVVRHYGPAYLTAVGTMSSAATLSVALDCARKSKVLRRDLVDFGIPLFANIHLCGSVLTEVFFCMTISKMLYGQLPSLGTMILFCLLLGIFAIGAPGVPGGTVMASLGLITGVLMFDDAGTALMLAIFALQDSFGTACNVTGDGALTLFLTGYAEKHHIAEGKIA